MYNSQKLIILDYMKKILTRQALNTFHHSKIFPKAVLCLGEKQGTLVNNKCSLWYNRVGALLMSVWSRRKEIFVCGNGSVDEVS